MESVPVWLVIFKRRFIDECDPHMCFYRTRDLGNLMMSSVDEEFSLMHCILKNMGTPADYQDYQIYVADLLKMNILVERIVYCE